jgi:hypothetical protein
MLRCMNQVFRWKAAGTDSPGRSKLFLHALPATVPGATQRRMAGLNLSTSCAKPSLPVSFNGATFTGSVVSLILGIDGREQGIGRIRRLLTQPFHRLAREPRRIYRSHESAGGRGPINSFEQGPGGVRIRGTAGIRSSCAARRAAGHAHSPLPTEA